MKEQRKQSPEPVLYLEKQGHNQLWTFRCQCGAFFKALMSNVKRGNTKSCGCHKKRVLSEKARKHGKTGTPIYRVWHNMMRRCYEIDNPAYKNYGARGIQVSRHWRQFENFYRDMGDKPKQMTLERVDNNGPYSRENCIWATRKQQARNQRSNHLVEIDGATKTVAEWAELAQIPYDRLLARIRIGWTGPRLLNKRTWERAKEALA